MAKFIAISKVTGLGHELDQANAVSFLWGHDMALWQIARIMGYQEICETFVEISYGQPPSGKKHKKRGKVAGRGTSGVVTVRFEMEVYEALTEYANKRGESLNEIVQRIIKRHLDGIT
jgi:hypothetical protein